MDECLSERTNVVSSSSSFRSKRDLVSWEIREWAIRQCDSELVPELVVSDNFNNSTVHLACSFDLLCVLISWLKRRWLLFTTKFSLVNSACTSTAVFSIAPLRQPSRLGPIVHSRCGHILWTTIAFQQISPSADSSFPPFQLWRILLRSPPYSCTSTRICSFGSWHITQKIHLRGLGY